MADIMLMGEKNPNYLGSFDLYDMSVQELTLTIKNIKPEEVITNGQKELLTACYFTEPYKPMILNATNKKRIAKLYGTKDSDKLAGKKVTIIIEKVKAFGKIHDALRVKEAIPKASVTQPLPRCSDCGREIEGIGNRSPFEIAQHTAKNYGRQLCAECATRAKEALQ